MAQLSHPFDARQIEHVAIIVTDLDRSMSFYGEVLGLREVPRPQTFDFPGAWYQIGQTYLHLLGKPEPDNASQRHFCLWVADLRSAAQHLQSRGQTIQWHTKHKIPNVDRFFVYDPDGNRIEVQGPETAPHQRGPVTPE